VKADCYDYVRSYYHVPAYVGVRVRFKEGALREGVVVGARSNLHYVHVRLDGQKHAVLAHPTDVEYLP
jgi:hypothetical protein